MTAPTETADAILDAAQRMVQTVGYNGLSFRDVAAAVGITSASVHYHFPSKARLGAALVRRYTDRLTAHLAALDAQDQKPAAAIGAYLGAMRMTLAPAGRMCLGGMLAAEIDALPAEVQIEVQRFIEANLACLRTILGRAGAPPARAPAVFAALEGAMLTARGLRDPAAFDAIVEVLTAAGLLPAQ